MYNVETLKILNCRMYIETLKSSVKLDLLKLKNMASDFIKNHSNFKYSFCIDTYKMYIN